MSISLEELKEGESAEVIELQGGFGFQQHLTSLGISPGKVIRRVAVSQGRGPVMVEVEGNTVTIGRGMASRIIVNPV